jgi:hypothetical protein
VPVAPPSPPSANAPATAEATAPSATSAGASTAAQTTLTWPWVAAGVVARASGMFALEALRGGDVDGALRSPSVPGSSAEDHEGSRPGVEATRALAEPASAPLAPSAAPPEAPSEGASARSIAREVAALDAVRARLAEGRADEALSELDAYDGVHPRGVLREEASVLRVEALIGAGQREPARQLAEHFLRAHPASPHAARVRALVGEPHDAP